jgi:hypothetical protein
MMADQCKEEIPSWFPKKRPAKTMVVHARHGDIEYVLPLEVALFEAKRQNIAMPLHDSRMPGIFGVFRAAHTLVVLQASGCVGFALAVPSDLLHGLNGLEKQHRSPWTPIRRPRRPPD